MRHVQSFDLIARIAFAATGCVLMLLAAGLVLFAGAQVTRASWPPGPETGTALLEAVGYTIIAIAVFDVGKYLIEEEAIRAREMRRAGEARQSMTKFLTTIAIAVFLEALVTVFDAGKNDVRLMLYPTLLLLAGVGLIVGLGVYQRLSATVEQVVAEVPRDTPGDHEHGAPERAPQSTSRQQAGRAARSGRPDAP